MHEENENEPMTTIERWEMRDRKAGRSYRLTIHTPHTAGGEFTGPAEVMLGTFDTLEEPTASRCTDWESQSFPTRAQALEWLYATLPAAIEWTRC